MTVRDFISLLQIGKLSTAGRQGLCLVRSMSSEQAIVRTSLSLRIGEDVQLGLRNGHDLHAIVTEAAGERVVLQFYHAISLSLLTHPHRRGLKGPESVRFATDCPVAMDMDGQTWTTRMLDISLFGMKIADDRGLSPGRDLCVHVDGLARRDAQVRWSSDGQAGLQLAFGLGYELLDVWLRR
ncbi:PilZ domain-containing protein [Sphingobium sp.]|uniref:PilZ domain-containing protein n=1 Tax=Sphingobium sp. TaxID=1912891 RepID=UPI002626BFBF|nr:PilZ domain-containing protein [Sphingobium sp.]